MIEIQNLTKIYNDGKPNAAEVLHDISFSIPDHAMTAIVGKSGSGKSTLLHILALIDRFQKGDVIWNGSSVRTCSERELARLRNQEIGLVLQDFALIPEYSVLENVMLPFVFSHDRKPDRKKKALQAMEQAGIADLAGQQASMLSGGQKQRAAIARAIVNQPSVLLADEPTGALDSITAAGIMQLFHRIHDAGTTVLIVTHDPEIASECGTLLRIADGRIAELRELSGREDAGAVQQTGT